MLTANFEAIKDFLHGNKNALQNVFIPPKEFDDHVKVYTYAWYLNDKPLNEKAFRHEFYSCQEAENDALYCKPDPGVDYDVKDGEPEMKITYELRVLPEDTELMNFVLVKSMTKIFRQKVRQIVRLVK